jgi:hypothetical protein
MAGHPSSGLARRDHQCGEVLRHERGPGERCRQDHRRRRHVDRVDLKFDPAITTGAAIIVRATPAEVVLAARAADRRECPRDCQRGRDDPDGAAGATAARALAVFAVVAAAAAA